MLRADGKNGGRLAHQEHISLENDRRDNHRRRALLGAPTYAGATQDTLFVWAGDAAHKAPDFFGVVDFDRGSGTYGKVLSIAPLPSSLPTAKWIAGGQNGVTLHAPKGLAIAGDVLYVADVTTVRKFDRRTGAPLGDIAVPGSTYLNGLAVAPGGKIYVSDSGPPDGSFEARGTEAIHVIDGARVTALAKGSALGRPTGVSEPTGARWWFPSGRGRSTGSTTRVPATTSPGCRRVAWPAW